jgi:nudix-type nucleoside diphosphatase (YffH/AdpP family)
MNDSSVFRPVSEKVLADDWGKLTKFEYDLRRRSGDWQRQTRETYDRGNGATCLLHDPQTDCVLLTRQFRLPVFLNGGLTSLIETPAGLLDGAGAAERMRVELIEETGYRIEALSHLFDIYMSPGSVTEYLAFLTGKYSAQDRVAQGGGSFEEGEDIEVLHVPMTDAMKMTKQGEIRDAKTIILLQHLMIERITADVRT